MPLKLGPLLGAGGKCYRGVKSDVKGRTFGSIRAGELLGRRRHLERGGRARFRHEHGGIEQDGVSDELRRQRAMCHLTGSWLVQETSSGGHARYSAELCLRDPAYIGNVLERNRAFEGDAREHLKITQPLEAGQQLILQPSKSEEASVSFHETVTGERKRGVGSEKSVAHIKGKSLQKIDGLTHHDLHFRQVGQNRPLRLSHMVGCVRRKNGIRDAGAGGAKRSGQVVTPPIRSQSLSGSGEVVDASFKFDVVRHGTVKSVTACRTEVLNPKGLKWLGRMKGMMS